MAGHQCLLWVASTRLAALGFDSRYVEKQLAHVDNSVKGVYNLYDFAPERKNMMQQWGNYLDQLRNGGNVTAIGSKIQKVS